MRLCPDTVCLVGGNKWPCLSDERQDLAGIETN